MVARRGHGHGQALKDGSVVVHHSAGFAVHEVSGANHAAAEGLPDRLVSEADSQHGYLPREVADQINADPRFMRCARAGRDDDPLGVHLLHLAHRDLVVAANLNFGA
jgi:hypothetical protein